MATVARLDRPERVRAYDFISSWNPPSPSHLIRVDIEDDSLREGPRAPLRRSRREKKKLELLRLLVAIGVGRAMISFLRAPRTNARIVRLW